MKLKLLWRIFVYELNSKKQGLLIGAGVGVVTAAYFINQGADLNTVIEGGKGVVDAVFNRQSAMEVAKYKMYLGFAFFGALVGYIGEWLFEALGVFKTKRGPVKRKRARR